MLVETQTYQKNKFNIVLNELKFKMKDYINWKNMNNNLKQQLNNMQKSILIKYHKVDTYTMSQWFKPNYKIYLNTIYILELYDSYKGIHAEILSVQQSQNYHKNWTIKKLGYLSTRAINHHSNYIYLEPILNDINKRFRTLTNFSHLF